MNTSPQDLYPHLLSPIKMGPLALPHRVIIPGHNVGMAEPDGTIGEKYRGYLVERAKGGAAIVGIGSVPVHPTSRMIRYHINLWRDEVIDGLARTADEVHEAGAKLSIILWHVGHNVTHYQGIVPVAPSAIPSDVTGEVPKVLTVPEITNLVEAYGAAAERCVRAGVDAIEIQTSSDYLLGSFLSPILNRRDDDYGGSLENRCRFPADVLKAARDAAGSQTAVSVRTCVEQTIRTDPKVYGLDDSLAAMKLLTDRGLADWVSLISGSHWTFDLLIPTMAQPRPQLAKQAKLFKDALDVPVVVAGRIRTPKEAEAIIAESQADVIAMARTFMADSHWMTKVLRGDANRIRPCFSCNVACIGFSGRGLPASCVVNAHVGRERELPPIKQAKSRKRVTIIGGGPAGMECARIAAERGHTVTLYESTDRLGGSFRLWAEAPHRSEMLDMMAWWESELQTLGVDVRINNAIGHSSGLAADEIIWAIGAVPDWTYLWRSRPSLRDGIPGGKTLPHGRDVMSGKQPVSGSILVIDEEGGWPAVSLAESLSANVRVSNVTVATSRPQFGLPDLGYTFEIGEVTRRLSEDGITVLPSTLIAEVHGDTAKTVAGENLGPFNGIVLSMGTASNSVPEGAKAIGDCISPRSLWAAVQDANELALRL